MTDDARRYPSALVDCPACREAVEVGLLVECATCDDKRKVSIAVSTAWILQQGAPAPRTFN